MAYSRDAAALWRNLSHSAAVTTPMSTDHVASVVVGVITPVLHQESGRGAGHHHVVVKKEEEAPRTSLQIKTMLPNKSVKRNHETHVRRETIRSELQQMAGRKLNKPVTSEGAIIQQGGRVPSRNVSLLSAICDMAERLIGMAEPRPRPMWMDPIIQLEGNLAPVDESPPQLVLEVCGTIPACLAGGAYIRNGGNPLHMPTGGYHYFDGDGMLHVLMFNDGEAVTHCCRYIKTSRFLQEQRAGRPLFTKQLGELFGLTGLGHIGLYYARGSLGILDASKGMGTANAGVAYFNGMLLAMSEVDLPYAMHVTEDGDVETMGRCSFDGALKTTMTAHPKVDPKTGVMFSFSCDLLKQPHLTYFRVSPDGTKTADVPITLSKPLLMHDFAITENYAVFPDNQIVFELEKMLQGKSPILADEMKVPRFGVLPKYATSEAQMQWFDLPESTCFHYMNAWEEGDEILVVGSVSVPLSYFEQPHILANRLSLFRLNLTSGKAHKEQLSTATLDMGTFNQQYCGQKNQFFYMSIVGPWAKFSGIAKVDLEAFRGGETNHASRFGDRSIVGWRQYPPGCFGGEPTFVPRKPGMDNIAEDDGYLITYYHDENMGVSELLILDSQSPTLDTVASIKMPSRVPYGFHGIFLTQHQLSSQQILQV